MNDIYIQIAQRSLTLEERLKGISYSSANALSENDIDLMFKLWEDILGSKNYVKARLGFQEISEEVMKKSLLKSGDNCSLPSWINTLSNILENLKNSSKPCCGKYISNTSKYACIVVHFLEYIYENMNYKFLMKDAPMGAFFVSMEEIMLQICKNALDFEFKNYSHLDMLFIKDEIEGFFLKYSYLGRHLTHIVLRAINNINLVMKKIYFDFIKDKKIEIEDMELFLSDFHNGNQYILSFRLSSGDRYIYKPRLMNTEKSYYELLGIINSRLKQDIFLCPKIILKSGYGYMEFIKHKEVESEEDLRKFFYRAGHIHELSRFLNSTDLHYENIIANGEYPVIIDGETVYNPNYTSSDNRSDKTGLLDEKYGGFVVKEVENKRIYNLPIYNGKIYNYLDFNEEFNKGKETMLSFLNKEGDSILSSTECQCLKTSSKRVIIRDTQVYIKLLHNSLQPKYLTLGIYMHLPFEKLYISYFKNLGKEFTKDAIELEIKALKSFDIPFFLV